MAQPELVESQSHWTGGLILQRNFDFHFFRLAEFPTGFRFPPLRVLNAQIFHTHSAGCLDVKRVFAANDQGAFLGRRNAPMSGTRRSQTKVRPIELLESPEPAQCPSD